MLVPEALSGLAHGNIHQPASVSCFSNQCCAYPCLPAPGSQHQCRRSTDRMERNVLMKRVDDRQESWAYLEWGDPKLREPVSLRRVSAELEDLSAAGAGPVRDPIEIGAWHDPRGLEGDRLEQQDRIQECRVLTNLSSRVRSPRFDQSIA